MELKRYGEISNLKVNVEKYEVLNISVPQVELRALRPLNPFEWKQRGLKYLGINLPVSVTDLYQDNYIPLLNEIKQELNGYPSGRLSWLGRINVIKMVTLPKALCIFQAIPINIPRAYFKTLKSLLKRFIQKHRAPHVAYKMLVRFKSTGGLSLPDFENYHKAAVLVRIIEWTHSALFKNWVQLEEIVSITSLGQTI